MKRTVSVVGAVIENEQGDILCALRSPKMSLPNFWEFPGGKIEVGEDPSQALIREIKEELDCEILVGEQIEEVKYEYEKVIVHLFTYASKIVDGTPKAKEHAKLEWKSLADLESLEWAPADVPTVNKLLNVLN
ncbi:(deoxy)nucleoside triphosphate pyrophosphohydrolase [Priestia megaterium]|nr:(deoxy)nucleoside triphosphate pyrophosphohydrolase [Priestia megaterium]